MTSDRSYWFPAKRYGWGWSLPVTWQGWAVLLGYLALVVGGGFYLLPRAGDFLFAGYVAALSVALVAICWWKGEPPSWRWGG